MSREAPTTLFTSRLHTTAVAIESQSVPGPSARGDAINYPTLRIGRDKRVPPNGGPDKQVSPTGQSLLLTVVEENPYLD